MLLLPPSGLLAIVRNRFGIGILAAATIALVTLLSACADGGGDNAASIDAPRSQPVEYTQAYVQAAIDYYEANGLDETIEYYSSAESMLGQWYLVISSVEGSLLMHPLNPERAGNVVTESVGVNGYPFGRILSDSASEDGVWVDYMRQNPVGDLELKHAWTIVHDGLRFSSGWFEPGPRRSDQPAYTQEYVRLALNLYDASGRDVLVDYYNDPVSVDGQWYLFVADESGKLIAHGADQDLVGVPLADVVGANGYPSGRIISDDADEDGEWSEYVFYNPSSGRSQIKHSWLIKHDGLIFGSGWYEDGPRKSEQPAYTQALVQQALNLYDSSGLDAALEYYDNPISVDDQWYVFIVDTETGRTIGHFNPDLRDRDPALRVDPTGYFYGDDLLAATEEGRWVSYVIRNPGTDEDSRKHTWAVLHDDHIFASGWYE